MVRTFKRKASPVAFCRQAKMSGMGPTAVRTTPSDCLHRAEAASASRQGRRHAAGLPAGHAQPQAASLLSGGRLLFLPSGSGTQSHTGEQEPELLLWGSTGKWALVSEMGAVLEPVCTGVFQTPPQGVNQGNSRSTRSLFPPPSGPTQQGVFVIHLVAKPTIYGVGCVPLTVNIPTSAAGMLLLGHRVGPTSPRESWTVSDPGSAALVQPKASQGQEPMWAEGFRQ